jgi:hypothetical protein
MSIVAEANVPNLLLELRLSDRTITYRGMMKVVPDGHWDSEVRPKLYPLWDTEKDRLIEFTWYDNNTYHCVRRKFIKNFKTGEYEWKNYEMEQTDVEAARSFYGFLKDTFINIEQIQNAEFQEEMGRMYGEVRTESWLSIRLARNFLLQETDYIFCSDVTIDADLKAEYQTYRQKLRDLPSQFADVAPNEVKFPISPESFHAVYEVNNPGVEYLSTEDQWTALGSFFFTQFRDKMARYLSVRDITDRMYNARFLEALRTNPVGMGGTAWSVDHQNLDSIKEQLDLLLDKLDDGGAA